MMTRVDYENVARVISGQYPVQAPYAENSIDHMQTIWLVKVATWRRMRDALADMMEAAYPNFNRERFLTACGEEVTV